tara:strand:+ start:325 stop:546 length:222 start_codon:yes stop_codon:yes gene_type:complete
MKRLKISQVIKLLQKAKKEFGDLPCVTSIDDEGNAFNDVIFAPTPMRIDEEGDAYNVDGQFEGDDNPNCICIN